jgi:hypothetical protein
MADSDDTPERKTYVVDTSILVSAPDALKRLTTNNTVLIPFPVLQELDRRRTPVASNCDPLRRRFLDTQVMPRSTSCERGFRRTADCSEFHSGTLDSNAPGPASTRRADDAIVLLADLQRDHPSEQVILVTRDAAMRCKARAAPWRPRTTTATGRWPRGELLFGRLRIDLPEEQAGLGMLRAAVASSRKSAWGLYKNHARRGTAPGEAESDKSLRPLQPRAVLRARDDLDDQTLIVSLVGMATGKTLIALLSAYEMLRSGKVSRIEVYRLTRRPAVNWDSARRPGRRWRLGQADHRQPRLHHAAPSRDRAVDQPVADQTEKRTSPIQPGNLRSNPGDRPHQLPAGQSIHDAAIIVDDGQNRPGKT